MNINRRTLLGASAAAFGITGFAGMGLAQSQKSSSRLKSTPLADGFRMPGEFENHEAIWLVWPEAPEWRLKGELAEGVIAKLAAAIASDIPVRLAATSRQAARVRSLVPEAVEVVEMNAGTNWVRDDGPTFLIDDKNGRRGVDWVFNGWGYPEDFWDTNKTARKLLKHEEAHRYRAPLVLEGGSIHSDGRGTIITTEECLLNPNRNPDLSREEIEEYLKIYLGARKVIWLPFGVFEDSTSGHVDNMCCFARPSEVILTWTDDLSDAQYERSQLALEVLETSTDADGNKFKVHKLHQPGPLFITDEEADSMPDSRIDEIEDRLAGSYVNYIITNRRVVFPLLDPETDPGARETLERAFPDREVFGVEGREILLHGGNFHCISQNLPARAGRN
ncbi:agmatine deiminase [Pelagibius sp. Alg239-R121]|uniref:agmatine deiminase n=1 Tax=Pelagibius sp. Alg239-R121 TaxID=2993448 RepID=UPI0024A7A39D|nr:agmatine deiminase [Pelagibius sp. Alg239-R121]